MSTIGLTRVDFGNDVDVASGGKVKALASSEKTGWLAEVVGASFVTAKSTGNVGIEVIYKVTDEDAVDIDGNSFVGKKQWDKIWFGAKSLKITKIKLQGLGIDVDNLIIEVEEDVRDLAETIRDKALGQEVSLITEAREDDYGTGEYDDGTQKYKSEVVFVNAVS